MNKSKTQTLNTGKYNLFIVHGMISINKVFCFQLLPLCLLWCCVSYNNCDSCWCEPYNVETLCKFSTCKAMCNIKNAFLFSRKSWQQGEHIRLEIQFSPLHRFVAASCFFLKSVLWIDQIHPSVNWAFFAIYHTVCYLFFVT